MMMVMRGGRVDEGKALVFPRELVGAMDGGVAGVTERGLVCTANDSGRGDVADIAEELHGELATSAPDLLYQNISVLYVM